MGSLRVPLSGAVHAREQDVEPGAGAGGKRDEQQLHGEDDRQRGQPCGGVASDEVAVDDVVDRLDEHCQHDRRRELEQELENGSIFHGEPSFAALPHLPTQGERGEIAERGERAQSGEDEVRGALSRALCQRQRHGQLSLHLM